MEISAVTWSDLERGIVRLGRPIQLSGMRVADYYKRFCDWKENMISVGFPDDEPSYIDYFIGELQWHLRLRVLEHRTSLQRVIDAYYEAHHHEVTILVDEFIQDFRKQLDEMDGQSPNEIQGNDFCVSVEEEAIENDHQAEPCAEILDGNIAEPYAHNVFDEMPRPNSIRLYEKYNEAGDSGSKSNCSTDVEDLDQIIWKERTTRMLNKLLVSVPFENRDDVFSVPGFAGYSFMSHLSSIKLPLNTLSLNHLGPIGKAERCVGDSKDVVLCADVSLFLFDPGGSSLVYKNVDLLELIKEQGICYTIIVDGIYARSSEYYNDAFNEKSVPFSMVVPIIEVHRRLFDPGGDYMALIVCYISVISSENNSASINVGFGFVVEYESILIWADHSDTGESILMVHNICIPRKCGFYALGGRMKDPATIFGSHNLDINVYLLVLLAESSVPSCVSWHTIDVVTPITPIVTCDKVHQLLMSPMKAYGIMTFLIGDNLARYMVYGIAIIRDIKGECLWSTEMIMRTKFASKLYLGSCSTSRCIDHLAKMVVIMLMPSCVTTIMMYFLQCKNVISLHENGDDLKLKTQQRDYYGNLVEATQHESTASGTQLFANLLLNGDKGLFEAIFTEFCLIAEGFNEATSGSVWHFSKALDEAVFRTLLNGLVAANSAARVTLKGDSCKTEGLANMKGVCDLNNSSGEVKIFSGGVVLYDLQAFDSWVLLRSFPTRMVHAWKIFSDSRRLPFSCHLISFFLLQSHSYKRVCSIISDLKYFKQYMSSHGYDGVTFVKLQSFVWDPGQDSLCILEDKDYFEKVGKRIIPMYNTWVRMWVIKDFQNNCIILEWCEIAGYLNAYVEYMLQMKMEMEYSGDGLVENLVWTCCWLHCTISMELMEIYLATKELEFQTSQLQMVPIDVTIFNSASTDTFIWDPGHDALYIFRVEDVNEDLSALTIQCVVGLTVHTFIVIVENFVWDPGRCMTVVCLEFSQEQQMLFISGRYQEQVISNQIGLRTSPISRGRCLSGPRYFGNFIINYII